MNTVFVINPKAGTGKKVRELKEKIQRIAAERQEIIEIYETKSVRDGELFVREVCEKRSGERLRFIACGGDGTFSEVVNGAVGFPDVSVGVMPIGTGNDFCRNFPGDTPFSDIEAQLSGEGTPCDVIRYAGVINGEHTTRYCVNMFNIGFDCNVAAKGSELRKIPFVNGKLSYLLAIFIILIQKKGANLNIQSGEETIHHGPLLLTSIANGSFCGGGICSNPGARLRDGKMDVNVVYNISRSKFLRILPLYMKGTHPSMKGIEKILSSHKWGNMVVAPNGGEMTICVDGEIIRTQEIHLEVMKNGISFSLPGKKNLNILEEKSNIKIG